MGQILLSKPKVCGFDIEWRVTYKSGEAPNKTALIQLCYCPNTPAVSQLRGHVNGALQ